MEFDKLKDSLLSEVDTGLKVAQSLDSKAEFEIYLLYRNKSQVDIKQGLVESTDGTIAGNAVRVAKNQSVSFSTSSGVTTDRIKRSIEDALSSLKALSVSDERFSGFIEPKAPGREGVCTEEILELTSDDLIKSAKNLVEDAQAVDDRIIAMGGCEVTWGGFAIGNTRGVQQASRSVSNSCGTYAMVIQGEERRTGQEATITREKVFDTTGLGEAAAKKAVSFLGAKKLDKTAQLPTLWVPWAAASYFLASLRKSVNGRPVVEKLSPLSDKIGEKIAPTSLTLIDDGQDPAGISTEAIDGEGYPQGKTPIIEKGILKQFLFDSYYGNIFGSGSTGNASRGGGPFGPSFPYEVTPSIATTNLEVSPGIKSEEELIATIDGQAILIADIPIGIFHSDVSTGEFSVVASSVFLIEAGEKREPLQPVSVAGNFYDGLKNLREIGSNREITPFGMAISSLIFDGFSIVG